jgi:hypothetical protein
MLKQTFLLTACVVLCSGYGQTKFKDIETFNISVVIDPKVTIEEKIPNIGVEIEYSVPMYARASITTFPALKGGYIDGTGAFGFTLSTGTFDRTNLYSGLRIGLIKRDTFTYPTYGFEAGINYNLTENLLLGIRSTYDYRNDFVFTSGNPSFRYSGFVKIGYTWNYKN